MHSQRERKQDIMLFSITIHEKFISNDIEQIDDETFKERYKKNKVQV